MQSAGLGKRMLRKVRRRVMPLILLLYLALVALTASTIGIYGAVTPFLFMPPPHSPRQTAVPVRLPVRHGCGHLSLRT